MIAFQRGGGGGGGGTFKPGPDAPGAPGPGWMPRYGWGTCKAVVAAGSTEQAASSKAANPIFQSTRNTHLANWVE